MPYPSQTTLERKILQNLIDLHNLAGLFFLFLLNKYGNGTLQPIIYFGITDEIPAKNAYATKKS